jgi:hypothetical protein
MSNQASLFAENTPDPYDPDRKPRAKDKSVFIAGAAYQVPVFWLCCFDKSDIAPVEWQNYEIPQLVSEMAPVRARLAERAALVKKFFPSHTSAWKDFRSAVEKADRKYLKLDGSEIWCLFPNQSAFGELLDKALNWFHSKKKADLKALFSLAGIEGYDAKTKKFSIPADNAPERYLYGWFEDQEL